VFDSDIMQKIEVYRALKRLKALLEQRGADVRIIYLPNGENGAKVGLDDFFAQGNTLDTLLEHAQKELKLPPDEAIRTEHTLVVDAVHDIPAAPGLRVPSGYELGEGGVLAVNMDQESLEERRTVVAPAPMIIAGRTTDIHDGRESAELVYKRGKQWVRQTASRAMISNSREIVKLADFGAPVTSGSAAGVVEYLGHFDTANITQLPHGRTSAQMGWQGRLGAEGFLWGKRLLVANQPIPDIETNVGDLNPEDWPENAVMFRGADVGDEQLAGGFSSGGTLEEWQNIMDRVTQFKKVRLTIVAALAAPVLEVINGYNFILDLANPTSRGKTTVLRLAASCWGNPDERAPESVLGTWDATRVWIERASSVLNSMPLMLDDTKRARHPRIVAQTLYDVASGRGRGRGSVHGLGRSGSWSTVLICTGEQPATSFTEDGGTRARVLTLWGSPFEVVSETVGRLVSSVDLLARENYGHAGPRLVQHLLDNHELWPQYRNKHSQYKRLYAEKAASDPVLGRMADYFATLRLTAEIATDHTRILPWEDFDPIEPLWDTLASEASEADRAESALRLVLSWAVSNQHTFYGREREDGYSGDTVPPHRGYSGKWDKQDWEYIAFYPHRIKRLIEDHGFDVESTLRTWRDRGWLDTEDEKRRNTKRLRISGERAHVVCITRDAYDEVLN
jgi:putative DNA primase/helicase